MLWAATVTERVRQRSACPRRSSERAVPGGRASVRPRTSVVLLWQAIGLVARSVPRVRYRSRCPCSRTSVGRDARPVQRSVVPGESGHIATVARLLGSRRTGPRLVGCASGFPPPTSLDAVSRLWGVEKEE